jgi:hypothetical protein
MGRTVAAGCGNQGENEFPHDELAQRALAFDPTLPDQHRSLKECVAARIYNQRGGLTAVAGKLDMSPSHLCEVLAGGGERNRKFDLDELEAYIEKFGDVTPILYLVAKFMPDEMAQQAQAMRDLQNLVQRLPSMLATIQPAAPRSRRRA